VTSVFNVTLWNLCVGYGLLQLPVGRSAILAYTMPVWTVLLSRVFLHERLTTRRLAGVALGMAAMGLLIGSELTMLRAAPIGAALIIAAALSWAVGTVLIKRFPTDLPTAAFTAWQMLLGGLPIAIGAPLLEEVRWEQMPWPATFAVWYNVAVGFVFCYWAWYKIVSRTSASVSALATLLIPVVGVFSSMLVLGEHPSWQEYLALLLVLGAIGTIVVPGRPRLRP
jgi:drug/metabolite transporter (DMT)-like permease